MNLHNADCLIQMQQMIDEGVQVDSVVTDPPYELGFMGKSWDSTGIAFQKETWKLAFKLLKPGGHLLAFTGSRTYHRIAVAIEDAGFDIRDQIVWLYGSGFPKSLNIGKAIDKKLGVERKVIGKKLGKGGENLNKLSRENKGDSEVAKGCGAYGKGAKQTNIEIDITEPATPEAKYWEGWGTALKPAHEPVVMARKPFEGTVANNVLKYGTGGINIDECRVGKEILEEQIAGQAKIGTFERKNMVTPKREGRYPANVMHDGSEEVLKVFPDSTTGSIKEDTLQGFSTGGSNIYGTSAGIKKQVNGSEGSAARFFYCPKVSNNERNGGLDNLETKKMGMSGGAQSKGEGYDKGQGIGLNRVIERKNTHPTVKPIELMKYLCRLVTPKGGTILDPFMGSGSTGMAAKDEGFAFIGIEKEKEYFDIAKQRITATSPLLDFL